MADDAGDAALRTLGREALRFQQAVGARRYLAPALPVYDRDFDRWLDVNRELLYATSLANGALEIDRRPLVAQLAPGRRALSVPERFLEWLLDVPVVGVYLQPLRLDPVNDSLEKLATYGRFVAALKRAGLAVIGGRLGAFGLLEQAVVGLDAFDSGLGEAERHDLAQLVRPRKRRDNGKRTPGGGRDRRIYIERLMTTLPS
jgi:hypothetical protein